MTKSDRQIAAEFDAYCEAAKTHKWQLSEILRHAVTEFMYQSLAAPSPESHVTGERV